MASALNPLLHSEKERITRWWWGCPTVYDWLSEFREKRNGMCTVVDAHNAMEWPQNRHKIKRKVRRGLTKWLLLCCYCSDEIMGKQRVEWKRGRLMRFCLFLALFFPAGERKYSFTEDKSGVNTANKGGERSGIERRDGNRMRKKEIWIRLNEARSIERSGCEG